MRVPGDSQRAALRGGLAASGRVRCLRHRVEADTSPQMGAVEKIPG